MARKGFESLAGEQDGARIVLPGAVAPGLLSTAPQELKREPPAGQSNLSDTPGI